jgi:hypothetical protein
MRTVAASVFVCRHLPMPKKLTQVKEQATARENHSEVDQFEVRLCIHTSALVSACMTASDHEAEVQRRRGDAEDTVLCVGGGGGHLELLQKRVQGIL